MKQKAQQQGWTEEMPKKAAPQQQVAAPQAAPPQQAQTDHLDRIFSKNVNILDTQKNVSFVARKAMLNFSDILFNRKTSSKTK